MGRIPEGPGHPARCVPEFKACIPIATVSDSAATRRSWRLNLTQGTLCSRSLSRPSSPSLLEHFRLVAQAQHFGSGHLSTDDALGPETRMCMQRTYGPSSCRTSRGGPYLPLNPRKVCCYLGYAMSGVDPERLPAQEARPPISDVTSLLVPAEDCVVESDPLCLFCAPGFQLVGPS